MGLNMVDTIMITKLGSFFCIFNGLLSLFGFGIALILRYKSGGVHLKEFKEVWEKLV